MTLKRIHAFILSLVTATSVFAMDTPKPEPEKPKDKSLEDARHYNEALRLDPKHLGAHEYIGEAYLMSGNLDKAREHLAQLDKLCRFGCKEYSELKKEVGVFEQQHAKK